MSHDSAVRVFEAIVEVLASNDKTRDPMNALVVWTEMGRGLAGKLERQGADVGLLGRIVGSYCADCADQPGAPAELERWVYKVEPDLQLSRVELGEALATVARAIDDRLVTRWGDGGGDARLRDDFLATVRGWFPVGLEIMRAMPAARGAGDGAPLAALAAWCARYLPKDASGPSELGVRLERRA